MAVTPKDAERGTATAVVRARTTLERTRPGAGEEITQAIILLDSWLARQPETVKRDLLRYFGEANLPVVARPEKKAAV